MAKDALRDDARAATQVEAKFRGKTAESGLTGSSLMVLPVIGALTVRGIDPSPVLREVGIDPRELSSPTARFPDASVQALWLRAPEVSGDPDFGIEAARLYRHGLFWILDDLTASSATLRDAYETGAARLRLLHDAAQVTLIGQKPLARLVFLPNLAAPVARAQIEFFMACLVRGVRRLTGMYEHPREVHFRHSRPASLAGLEAFFECPLHFGAEANEIVFPEAWLDWPVLSADSKQRSQIEHRADSVLAGVEHALDFATRVRLAIGAELFDAQPALSAVAKRLALSTRTLRRRLQELGTSYSEVLDGVRQNFAARHLLEHHESIDEIARRLGFATPQAFFKAHKRWTGRTPLAVRRAGDMRVMGVRPAED